MLKCLSLIHIYSGKALRFIRGNAENLPISTACMDIVINVESSHGYPHIDKFFSEVNRVLKPGGYFLFADFRPKSDVSDLLKNIQEAGLKIISERCITENVVAALDLIHTAREQQIGRLVPFIFRGMSRQFTALKGTSMYNSFKSGDFEYVLFIIQK